MEIYIVRIGIVKSAYPSLESAQDALNRFLQSNKEYTDYEIYPVVLMASHYVAILINKKTEEHTFIESRLSDTLEEFRESIEMDYSKDYLFDILPYFCL